MRLRVPFLFFSLALLALIAVSFCVNGRFLGIDDAHIFFNYAENICRGNGVTYSNNGVTVEGYTSPLWLLICVLNFQLGFNEIGVFACSIVFLLLAQKIWIDILDQLVAPCHTTAFIGRLAYFVMILSSFGYITWMTVTLMDSVLWGVLLAWMTKVFIRAIKSETLSYMDAVPFLLAPLCRPEAMFVCPVNLGLLLVYRWQHGKHVRDILWTGVVFALSLLAITAFRKLYFGYPLPNTYYAKVSPSVVYNLHAGLQYATAFLVSGIVPYLFMACFLVKGLGCLRDIAIPARRQALGCQDFVWLWAMALFLPPILTGGDHFALSRFYQPQYPLFGILVIAAILPYVKFDGTRMHKAILCFEMLVFLVSAWSLTSSWLFALKFQSKLENEFTLARDGMEDGQMFSDLFRDITPRPVIGVVCAGGIARTYDGRVEDLMGLNNLMVAHSQGERKGVKNHAAFEVHLFEKINVDVMPFAPEGFYNQCVKGLCTRGTFAASWRFGKLRWQGGPWTRKPMLISNRLLASLLERGDFEFQDTLLWNGSEWAPPEPPRRRIGFSSSADRSVKPSGKA